MPDKVPRGGPAHLMRVRGQRQRAAFLAMCEKAIATGIPLPHLADIAQQCGLPSQIQLSARIAQLCQSGEISRVYSPRGSAPVFRLRDGRTTPAGILQKGEAI